MSPSHHSQIQSITLVISVVVLALVFGIMLDDKIVPEAKQPLMTEEATKGTTEQDSNKTAKTEKEQTHQEQDKERRDKQASKTKRLDQKAEVTVKKADKLNLHEDELISKTGLMQPSISKQIAQENKNIAKRLTAARSRLDALKK